MQRSLLFLKIISVVAPLMGLLGTVTGMIKTFQAITLFGTGDPKLMAGGISQALVTTVLGLVVAIPMVLLTHPGQWPQQAHRPDSPRAKRGYRRRAFRETALIATGVGEQSPAPGFAGGQHAVIY